MNVTHVAVFGILGLAISVPLQSEIAAGGIMNTQAADREASAGAALYREHCAQCHDQAIYKAPAKLFLQFMAPDVIYNALSAGVMQSQASRLNDEQKKQVAAYLGDESLQTAKHTEAAPRCDSSVLNPAGHDAPELTGWGVDEKNTHSIPAKVARLSVEDIPRLKLRWAFAFPGATRARSQPSVAMGTVFVGSQSGAVYALDAHSGCIRWTFHASAEVRTPVVLSPDAGKAASPRAFFGDLVGKVYALDASTGALIWKARLDDHPAATITGAPAYYRGHLYVAVSSLEEANAGTPGYECCTFRGSVVALDANDGRVLWKHYTIDEPAAPTTVNAQGVRIMAPSGASIWNSPTIDAARKLLYVGTGDNYSLPANDRSDAILAFDLATGRLLWSHQLLAEDSWNSSCLLSKENCPLHPGPDFDIGAGAVLLTRPGHRDLILVGQKNGRVTALNPDAKGERIWARQLGRGGIEGGVQFGLAADRDDVYVPISDMTATFGAPVTEAARPGLNSIDATTGHVRWSTPANNVCAARADCDPGILAAISVIPGAVFAGHMDGRIRAYDRGSGHVLWEYDSSQAVDTLSGVKSHGGSVGGGGPVVVDGVVYVNSGYGIYAHMPGNVLLAFSVGR